MAFKRSMKPSHAARKWLCGILSHWRRMCQPCFPKYPRHNSSTDWYPQILVAFVRWKWSEEPHFLTIPGWRVLSAMLRTPVEKSNVCGRNVCVPKASIQPPEYFRDNINFQLNSLASKHDRFVCLQTAEWFLIGETQIRPQQLFDPYDSTFFLCFGKILHFLDLQWLYSNFIFQYLPNGILRYVQLTSHFSATATRNSIKSLLYFSKHFCWCGWLCFFVHFLNVGLRCHCNERCYETQKMYSHLYTGGFQQ